MEGDGNLTVHHDAFQRRDCYDPQNSFLEVPLPTFTSMSLAECGNNSGLMEDGRYLYLQKALSGVLHVSR